MQLFDLYGFVEVLIRDLRSANLADSADEVERALRGGATSGEILANLGTALEKLEDESVDVDGVREALVFIQQSLGSR